MEGNHLLIFGEIEPTINLVKLLQRKGITILDSEQMDINHLGIEVMSTCPEQREQIIQLAKTRGLTIAYEDFSAS